METRLTELVQGRRYGLDARIVEQLEAGPKTRGELVEALGVPRTTIYDHLFEMVSKGVVGKKPIRREGRRGRPFVAFFLTREVEVGER